MTETELDMEYELLLDEMIRGHQQMLEWLVGYRQLVRSQIDKVEALLQRAQARQWRDDHGF